MSERERDFFLFIYFQITSSFLDKHKNQWKYFLNLFSFSFFFLPPILISKEEEEEEKLIKNKLINYNNNNNNLVFN